VVELSERVEGLAIELTGKAEAERALSEDIADKR
jgi:hypothetical protein